MCALTVHYATFFIPTERKEEQKKKEKAEEAEEAAEEDGYDITKEEELGSKKMQTQPKEVKQPQFVEEKQERPNLLPKG